MSVKKILFGLVILAFYSSLFAVSFDFEDVNVSKTPSGWLAQTTHSKENLATWKVEKKDKNNILTITKIKNSMFSFGGAFNLFYTKKVDFKDGEISVKFKANSGKTDQGGGIMWRVRDKNNYYVTRFNPLEDNFIFYSVTDGNRRELKSADIHLKNGWHTMKIVQHAEHFEGYLDDKKLLDAKNSSIQKSGGVGLWTKSDAATSFDNFVVVSR